MLVPLSSRTFCAELSTALPVFPHCSQIPTGRNLGTCPPSLITHTLSVPRTNLPYARRVFLAIVVGMGFSLLASLGPWIIGPESDGPPMSLFCLPFGLGIPYLLLGAPMALFGPSKTHMKTYSWGAVVLALSLAATWCVYVILDPHMAHAYTQKGLLFGWMAGGTAYEVLLLLLVVRS